MSALRERSGAARQSPAAVLGRDPLSAVRAHLPFRRDIQGLRAVDADADADADADVFDHVIGWPSRGFVDVDVFFVNSVFPVTRLHLVDLSSWTSQSGLVAGVRSMT